MIKSILAVVLLSVWMAIPAIAETKVIRPAKFRWDHGTVTVQVVTFAIYSQIGTSNTYLGQVPRQTGQSSGVSISRPYREKFTVVVLGVNSLNKQEGVYSDPASGEWSTFPNFDYNGSGCVDSVDFSTFKQDYFKSVSANPAVERSDADLNGVINSLDFSAFSSVYGKCIVGGKYQ